VFNFGVIELILFGLIAALIGVLLSRVRSRR